MKKYLFIIILLIANIYGQQNRTIGDINDDGEINVIDVVLLVSNILENTYNENGNINQDDLLNILDVVLLVDIILNPTNIDILDSAFFGLDNALPGLLCNQPGTQLDGMPVNFKFPLNASSLSETDFEVLDSFGNIYTPNCVSLAP